MVDCGTLAEVSGSVLPVHSHLILVELQRSLHACPSRRLQHELLLLWRQGDVPAAAVEVEASPEVALQQVHEGEVLLVIHLALHPGEAAGISHRLGAAEVGAFVAGRAALGVEQADDVPALLQLGAVGALAHASVCLRALAVEADAEVVGDVFGDFLIHGRCV